MSYIKTIATKDGFSDVLNVGVQDMTRSSRNVSWRRP
jgi:hypothetical protein